MDATDTLVEVLKGEGPRVLATLARTIGDLAVAEDALSEATITALDAWPRTGIPDNPRAWLAVVARRKALDLLRRESARAAKETAAFRWGTGAAPDQIEEAIEAMEPESSLRDDMLRLIFTCCHPALGREAQVALSLRTLARLEVPAIARAFLVPEATMAKRLVRARSKIATARIPYAIPSDTELPGRLASGAGGGVPGRHRGPRPDRRGRGGPCRSRGRGDPAGSLAGQPDARRARGALPACLVAADLGPHLRPHRCRR